MSTPHHHPSGVQTVGFIGSGHIGGTVARLAARVGYYVLMSNSRGPQTLGELVDEIGPRARAGTVEEAAEQGDMVVVTIPLKAYQQVPVHPLRDKVVIDTNNYYPQRDGQIAELDDESTTVSELLQRHLPEAKVVKALNNINYAAIGRLARPTSAPDRTTLPIAGDDPEAKALVSGFLDHLGFNVLDAGPLSEGWRFQRDTPAYSLYAGPGGMSDPVARNGDEVRARLDEAKRYRDM